MPSKPSAKSRPEKVHPFRAALTERDEEYLLLTPEYDSAIVGILDGAGSASIICYDQAKVIAILMKNSEMDEEEAREFFDFNIIGAYIGEKTPLFLTTAKSVIAGY